MEPGQTVAKSAARLPYLAARFDCRLTSDALFSAYKGSMLRGALGAHLRKGLCMTRDKDCRACILARNCVFPRIFSPLPAQNRPAPVPFCIEPDLDARRAYEAREGFGFNLKLFCFCVDYLPFFVQAFRMAANKGMGDSAKPGTFVIEQIICQGKPVYNSESDNLDIPQPQYLPLPEVENWSKEESALKLELLTPLRHKSGNHFSANLEFPELFRLILRRVRAIYLLAGIQWRLAPDEFSALLEASQRIRITQNNLHWQDWARYSSRQETYMKFGGLTGNIIYEGNIAPFLNLLQFAEIAHIGKQASFGLGQIMVVVNTVAE